MRAINLLPKDDGRRSGTSIPTPVAISSIAGVTLVAALLGLLFVSAHGTVKSRRLELAQKQQELAAIPVPAQNQVQQQDALVADKQARVTALNAALARRIAWDRVLREFALVLPDDVWLLNLSAHAPTSASATAATAETSSTSSGSLAIGQLGFTIDGYTYSHDAVARLLTRLSVIPDLEQVQLVTSEQAMLGDRSVVHFKVAANVRAAGASS
ncbi:MAG: PilN domain-containing protein [Actinobacteria bacterium]|nr:MAG: PilN domain-containing protein [Actinomycetota bacterium]TMM26965.1 MAG: PilN domain-containing protein [Actinomycetota bacterium]